MLYYDEPLYRPPSEGNNLIIQATLGCSFNRCTFCSMYKTKEYVARPLEQVKADIDAAARLWPSAHRVFLADGDALALPTETLEALCGHLAARLPSLQRVTAYATPANLLRKTPDALARLRAAGLTMVYLGIESGNDVVLRAIVKGASGKAHAEAITKARDAGIKVSGTVILGVGGRERWREHIRDTARLVSEAPPNFLSTLQLYLAPEAEAEFLEKFGPLGGFTYQDDAGVLDELDLLLTETKPDRPVIFRSNHASNALALAGNLPKDGPRLLAEVRAARSGGRGLRPAFMRGL